jgi:hypothetical protein
MGAKSRARAAAVARQQERYNREAFESSIVGSQFNQVTPFGSLTYTGAPGSQDRTATQTFTPEIQAIIDAQVGVTGGLTDLATNRLGGITTDPFDLSTAGGRRIDLDSTDRFGRPMVRRLEQRPLRGEFDPGGQILSGVDRGGQILRGFDPGGQVQMGVSPINVSRQIAGAGAIGRDLGFGSLGALPGAQDFSSERSRVENALFERQAGRINPQFDRDIDRRITQLANQGITEFSNPVAFEEGLRPFIEGRTDALDRASMGAITGAGGEQSRMFGDVLAARSQRAGELSQQGTFGNLAQGQQFGQNLQEGQFDMAAAAQNFQQQLQAGQFGNLAQEQLFGQNQRGAEFANLAQAQQFGQNIDAGQFANQAQQQQFGQNAFGAEFFNTAQGQRFLQDQGLLQGDLAAGQFGNQSRDAFIQELILQRNQPLNELSALLGGGPALGTPSFRDAPGFQMASPDVMGLEAARLEAQAAKSAGMFGALGKVGGAFMGAAGAAGGFAPLFAGMCWVAREVYGPSNPKWLQFREWMLNKAPVWLRTLYLKYGERIAAFISDKPFLKRVIKSWMDTKIEAPA